MVGSRISSKKLSIGLLSALLLGALLPASVAAATRPIKFHVQIGDHCIYGSASDAPGVNLLWQAQDGRVKLDIAFIPNPGGSFSLCYTPDEVIEVGDRIYADDGHSVHELIIPELTLVIDRVNDRFKGRAPAGDYVRLVCGYVNGFEPCRASWKIKASAHGRWGWNPPFDVTGWQEMWLNWKSDGGDGVTIDARGPHVDVTIGNAIVRGSTRPGALVTLLLRRAGSDNVVAMASKTANDTGRFQAKFRNANGKLVKVRVGDRIFSNVAPDQNLTVPNVTGSFDAESNTGTGTCTADTFFVSVTVNRNGEPDGPNTWVENDLGTFNVDFSGLDLLPGESVKVTCILVGNGELVSRKFIAQ
jgi:hypothetical protein